jgi:hypothetical protein
MPLCEPLCGFRRKAHATKCQLDQRQLSRQWNQELGVYERFARLVSLLEVYVWLGEFAIRSLPWSSA